MKTSYAQGHNKLYTLSTFRAHSHLYSTSHRGLPVSISDQSTWDLSGQSWHWDRIFSEYFSLVRSVFFFTCPILIYLSSTTQAM